MLISFTCNGQDYQIDARHIACIIHSGAGNGPVNVTIRLAGCAQPLTLQLPTDQFAVLARAFEVARADGSGGNGCADGEAPAGTGPGIARGAPLTRGSRAAGRAPDCLWRTEDGAGLRLRVRGRTSDWISWNDSTESTVRNPHPAHTGVSVKRFAQRLSVEWTLQDLNL